MGYYGFGNAGDEHLLWQTKRRLIGYATHVLPSRRLIALWDMAFRIPRSQVVVFGGGSLFQDRSSWMSMVYYLLVLTWAVLWRRRIVLWGHGVGPVSRSLLRWWLGLLLPHVSQVVARDGVAYRAFLAFGSVVDRTVLGVDLAYWSGPRRDRWSPEGQIAVSSKGAIPAGFRNSVLALGLPLFWIEMMPGCDGVLDPWGAMGDSLALENEDNRRFRACVSYRYHACVWASLRGIPFLAVGDDPKLCALAETFGQPRVSSDVAIGPVLASFLKALPAYRAQMQAALTGVLGQAARGVSL